MTHLFQEIFNIPEKGYPSGGTASARTHILSECLNRAHEFKQAKKRHRPAPMPLMWTHILSYKPIRRGEKSRKGKYFSPRAYRRGRWDTKNPRREDSWTRMRMVRSRCGWRGEAFLGSLGRTQENPRVSVGKEESGESRSASRPGVRKLIGLGYRAGAPGGAAGRGCRVGSPTLERKSDEPSWRDRCATRARVRTSNKYQAGRQASLRRVAVRRP